MSLSLGLLLHALFIGGHVSVKVTVMEQFQEWESFIENKVKI